MKRGISFLMISLCSLLMFASVRSRIAVKANGGILYVPSTDFPTIQSAIDNASSGATILIAGGTYYERLTIGKSLSLKGENRDGTIIDGVEAEDVVSIAADNVTIEALTIMKSGTRPFDSGVRVDRGRGIVINNTRMTNTYVGLTLSLSSNNVFSDNIIVNNTNGIMLLYSNYNTFSNNIVSDNKEGGMSLYYSNNNVFFGNTLSNNYLGVLVSSPSNRNSFYHNNFQDTVQVIGGSPPNIWSRGDEGNYWGYYNFTERDSNHDGIGDEPYFIDVYNQDNYPLMGTFSEFTVTFQQKICQVAIITNSTVSDFRFEIGKETGSRIVTFNVAGGNRTTGFCRMMITTSLMDYPYTVLDREGEISMSLLSPSNATNAFLYFAYVHGDQSITVISSKALQLYNELLDEYSQLKAEFDSLNTTYQSFLNNYNATLQTLLDSFNLLLKNFTELENGYLALNSSLQKNLMDQSDNMQNIRNLSYIFAATTAAFLITTAYLSNRVHATGKSKASNVEEG